MINKYTYRQKEIFFYGILGLFFSGLSFLTNVTFPVIILTVVLLCKIVPLPASVNHPTVRLVFAIILQLTLFNIFGLLFYLTNIEIGANTYGVIALITTGAVFITGTLRSKDYKIGKFSKFDLITVVPVVIAASFLLFYIFGNHLSFSENLVRFMGSSSDQSAHLSMFNDILRNNGNYVYGSDKLSINTHGINSYPMGWHQAMATLSAGLFNVNPTTVPFSFVVSIYFVCAFITFILYGIIVSVFTGLLYDKFYAIKRFRLRRVRGGATFHELFIKSFTTLIVIFLFLYIVFAELGYINFIYAAAIALMCGTLLIGTVRKSDISVSTLSTFAILLFAAFEAWGVMGLPLGMVLLVLMFIYFKNGIKPFLRSSDILILFLSCLLLGLAFLATLHNVLKDGSSEQIIIGGAAAIWLPSTITLLGVITTAIILSNRGEKNLLHILMNCFFASIVLLTAINFAHLQEYSYYQQKMLYAFFAFCLPITFIWIIKYMQEKRIHILLTVSIIPFLIYMIDPKGVIYLTKNLMRPTVDVEIGIVDKYFQSSFNDKSQFIFIKDFRANDNRSTESYARLLLSKVVSPGDCYNQLAMPLLTLSDQNKAQQRQSSIDANKTAIQCYGKTKFYILADNQQVKTELLKGIR